MSGGGGSTQTTVQQAPVSPEEKALIGLQTQLAQQQLSSVQQLQPYQQQLLDYSTKQLSSQQAYQDALDAAISPADQAAAQKAQFDQAAALAPIQTQLAQMQLDALKQGGVATDAQKQAIADATNSAITAGNSDIDTNTQRGIGLISDELANSRGLRLSDSPITSEAALLARAGSDQKSSLENNLRASQASATLNYPLAVQSLQSGINLGQQNTNTAFQSFQDQLRQQAYQNRVALTQPAITTGLGLSGISSGIGSSISALNSGRGTTTDSSSGIGISGIGSLLQGGAAAYGAFTL